MPFPFFAVGPSIALAGRVRDWQQSRRRVRLTVHRAFPVTGFTPVGEPITSGQEHFYVNVTNTSKQRDIVVTHLWFAAGPERHIFDPDLPKRLPYDAPWETAVPVKDVPASPEDALWLARARLSTGQVVKSRPNVGVPDFGIVPRG